MSEIQANKLSPASGTALQVGDSGDTITIPSGATITNSGTATGFGVTGTNLFKATMSSSQTSVTDATWTKVLFNTDSFDTDNVFDTSNNRFVAPASGKYFFLAKVGMYPNSANGNKGQTRFYKNGSSIGNTVMVLGLGGSDNYQAENYLINSVILNLSQNDYIEYYGFFNAPSGSIYFDKDGSHFQGYRIV